MKVLVTIPDELLAWTDSRARSLRMTRSAWLVRMLEITRQRLERPEHLEPEADLTNGHGEPTKARTRRETIRVDPKTIVDRNGLVSSGARHPIGFKQRVMGKDGKSGAPLCIGWNVLTGYDGDTPVWKYEGRQS
jgi:hypothetical protein